jgi:hypothetical protein
LVEALERAAAMLRDPDFDFDQIWGNANDKEGRVLIEELIDCVAIYADRLEVVVAGAPRCSCCPVKSGYMIPVRDRWCRRGDLNPHAHK